MASVSKRPNGKWEVRYLSEGRHLSKTFLKKKDADRFRGEVEVAIQTGTLNPSTDVTVRTICEAFLRHSEDRMRDRRIGRTRLRSLRTAVDHHILPAFGKMKFSELTAVIVEDAYRDMVRKKGQVPATAKLRIGVFREVEKFAAKRYGLRKTPVAEALQELRGISYDKIATFTADQVLTLLQTVAVRHWRAQDRSTMMMNIMVNIAAFCGLRFGEITGLTVENVDFGRQTIKVRHSLTCDDELKEPKTRAGVRDVPMPGHVSRMIQDWITRHYLPNDRGLIFRTKFGEPFHHSNFHGRFWRPLLKRAGLYNEDKPFHFHALRHFAASWMIENGLPVTEVALLLGHSKFDMTLQTYAHPVVSATRRHEAIERMASTILPALAPPVAPELRCDP